jgi:hypothetical protein
MFRNKIFFLFLIGLSFSIQSFSQKVNVTVVMDNKISDPKNDMIYYDFNRPLTWADFQGKPDPNHFGGAVTASGFAFNSEINYNDNRADLVIHVYTYFSKERSWQKPNVSTPYHLEHEQHHFDITRLGAERFVEELRKADFTINNYKTLINSIFNKVYKENNELQQQYDSETKNSLITAKQLEWNKKITEEINRIKKVTLAKNGGVE